MIMSLKEFKLLHDNDRYVIWLAKAIEVGRYEKYGILHVLYQLDSFYVEMSVPKALPENVEFIAFSNSYRLLPYLEKIDISGISKQQSI